MNSLPVFVINEKIADGASMGANVTSSVADIAEVSCFCVHAIWTGTPTGDIKVQASNDNTNFADLATEAAGGAAGQYLYNVAAAGYRYVRVTYTRTSGTGALTVYLSGKR